MGVSAVPFQLEEHRITGGEELMQAWLKELHQKRTDLFTLYGIEVLTVVWAVAELLPAPGAIRTA